VKLVNLLPVKVASRIRLEGVSLVDPSATKTLLTGEPQSKDAKPVTSPFEIGGEEFSYEMPPYSFTVIRIGQGEKK
ncbi:hypothetical protein, partial [Bacteroides heparinolyticus]